MNLEEIDYLQKVQRYMMTMRSVFQPHALFSDETANYVEPMEPMPGETVTIRFRAGLNNVDSVFLISGSRKLLMDYEKTEGRFDYYTVKVEMTEEIFRYYFEVCAGKISCFYNKRGVSRDLQEYYSFAIAPGFRTPDWAKGAVMYQIYTDRFYNGDPTNDVEDREYYYIGDGSSRVRDWYKYPEFMGIREFYGGDLQGVLDKMDYLEDLGVEVIYFNPIFVSPSNHKYDIQDYDSVDPHLGKIVNDGGECLAPWDNDNTHATKYIKRVTDPENLKASNELLAHLVEEAHKRGMKVILDGVFNHCGSFNKWLDRERIYENQPGYEKGAYVSADSPYRSFFKFNNEHSWPYNPYYDGWWGHETLPKLNFENSPKLVEYIMNIGRKWVSPPYNVDGWRLDVAADLGFSNEYNHKFWKEFRKNVKEANPEAIILAEHYGEARSWLQGDEWDTVMNYDAFMEPLTWFLTGMEKHSDEYKDYMLGNIENFENAMTHYMASFGTPSLQCAMNQLSNHDHSRFLTRTNHKVGRAVNLGTQAASEGINRGVMKEAVIVQMTWPGAPTLYYGDEAGLCGFTDPDNRRTYPWGKEDKMLIRFHRDMIRIHRENPAFCTGSVKFLHGDRNILCYTRFNREQQFIIVINNDGYTRNVEVGVCGAGVPKACKLTQIMYSTEENYSMAPVTYQVEGSYLSLTLPKYSAVILRHLTGED